MKIQYRFKAKLLLLVFLILSCTRMIAQNNSTIIQGQVISNTDKLPLIGVSISELDVNNRIVSSTVTDVNGRFVLRAKSVSNRIQVNYVGYVKQIRRIEAGKKNDFLLSENSQTIKQVEVTAKKRMGNAIS